MISKRIVLKFPPRLADQPIVSNLAKYFDLEFNILKAYIKPKEEGLLVLGLSGEEENYNKGINYLKELGLIVQPLSLSIIQNSSKCTCLLYTSDAADEEDSVDLGGRRIIKKKK